MTALPRKGWTVEAYLAFERESDVRHEYVNGEIFVMAGGRGRHNALQMSIGATLDPQLPRDSCLVYSSDQKVHINANIYRYPDLTVVCGTSIFEDENEVVLLNPQIVIEVLSPSTEIIDRKVKFYEYLSLPSIQEIIFVASDERRIECFARHSQTGGWSIANATQSGESVALPSVNAILAIDDVYARVSFDAPPTDDAPMEATP